jgi:hypothetical protein
MFRFIALSNKHPLLSVVRRYGIAIASVAGAFAVVFLLQRIHVRNRNCGKFLVRQSWDRLA